MTPPDPADDLIDLLYSFALYLVVEDCYVPEVAGALIEAWRGLDDESARVTVELWATGAEGDARERVN